jgi:hypothetical protein
MSKSNHHGEFNIIISIDVAVQRVKMNSSKRIKGQFGVFALTEASSPRWRIFKKV